MAPSSGPRASLAASRMRYSRTSVFLFLEPGGLPIKPSIYTGKRLFFNGAPARTTCSSLRRTQGRRPPLRNLPLASASYQDRALGPRRLSR